MRCKLIYIICLFFTGIGGLYAQPEPDAPLQQQNVDTEEKMKSELGVKINLGVSTFTGNAFDNARLKRGFGAGIYNVINLNKPKTVNLQWELNFTMKGSKFGKVNDTSYSDISVFYVEVPAYFSVQVLNTKKQLPMHLLIGAQFGYMFRSSIDKRYGKYGSVKTNLPFNRIDLAPSVGIRKKIGTAMSLQFSVKPGLLNIYNGRFKDRVDRPDPDDPNYDYRDIVPTFKDGTHKAWNIHAELSVMFGI
mgnify:CR=1 FL=1